MQIDQPINSGEYPPEVLERWKEGAERFRLFFGATFPKPRLFGPEYRDQFSMI